MTDKEIRERYERRGNHSSIHAMSYHQDWVKLHCEDSIDKNTAGASYRRFCNMVKGLLPKEKYDTFMSLVQFPLPSTTVTSVIFDRLSRVFEGRNPAINYQFKRTEYADNWEWYRQDVLGEPNVWKSRGWDYFRTEPNSFIVVDMPEVKKDPDDRYAQPYFYWVTIDNVIDYGTDEDGSITWFMFRNEDTGRIYEIDDEYYRSYAYTDGGIGDLIVENPHKLGYCPVTFFVTQPISISNPDVKESPVTKALSELDWYNFYAISKRHLDLYASYPIYYGYEADCEYSELLPNGSRRHCEHGVMVDDNGNSVKDGDGNAMRCPACAAHRTAGAGSYIQVPVPQDGEIDLGEHPVGMLTVDKDALQFNSDELERKKKNIISMCVGVDADTTISTFSVSDKQVDANYESQSTILIRVKKTFETAQKFVDDTICRLRYGNGFVSSSINYGSEFYTLSTTELRERLKKATESGASEGDLSALRRQIIETEYRNNPLQMQRMLILNDIEPLLGMSKTQAMDAMFKGLVDEDECKIKINFDSLIRRFERENGNILEFGEGGNYEHVVNGEKVMTKIPYDEKIEKIKQTLKEYVNEIRVRSTDTAAVQTAPAE